MITHLETNGKLIFYSSEYDRIVVLAVFEGQVTQSVMLYHNVKKYIIGGGASAPWAGEMEYGYGLPPWARHYRQGILQDERPSTAPWPYPTPTLTAQELSTVMNLKEHKCDTCETYFCTGDHGPCANCGDLGRDYTNWFCAEERYLWDSLYFCTACLPPRDQQNCAIHGTWHTERNLVIVNYRDQQVCDMDALWEAELVVCSRCEDRWMSTADYYWEGEPVCEYCYEEVEDYDEEEEEDSGWFEDQIGNYLYGWSDNPEFVFYPAYQTNTKFPLWIGMEVEIAWDPREAENAKDWCRKLKSDKVWLKTDSSIKPAGMELVTMPIRPDLIEGYLPLDHIERAAEYGAFKTHTSTGTHLHMSREAFSGKHLYSFVTLQYETRELCELIGGRRSTYYANLALYDKKERHDHALTAAKKLPVYGQSRYDGINMTNEDTIEVRYPRGSIEKVDILKNVEWLTFLYELSGSMGSRVWKEIKTEEHEWLTEQLREHLDQLPNLKAWIKKEGVTL